MQTTTTKPARPPTARSIALKQKAEDLKKRKLHAIATRRAASKKMSKKDYIAAIVAGQFLGITQEDIAAEPDPGAEDDAQAAATAGTPASDPA